MRNSKPVDKLALEDFRENPIWEWLMDEEQNEEQDETWVRPSNTQNFTEELNGSIVTGKLATSNGTRYPMMCSLDIEEEEVFISSVVFYNETEDKYYALEEVAKKIQTPLFINLRLKINGKNQSVDFIANKLDIYKNNIRTTL